MCTPEIEISIFGPGIGEAIAFCFKKNWILIDSCFDHTTNKPASLAYLDRISEDEKLLVKLIVLTHWHDDHIKGASELIKACKNASIVLPTAFEEKDFRQLYVIYNKRDMVNPNGLEEIHKILQLIYNENRHFLFGSFDKMLFQEVINEDVLRAWSISPSDHAALMNQISLSSCIANCSPRINAPKQNHFAIATVISINENYFLFGADLENYKNDKMGWDHVLNKCNCVKGTRSRFFKIAHHGSINGDHSDVWTNLLTPNPIAAITPYYRGRMKLPSGDDVTRIKTKTTNAYITCKEPTSKYKDKHTIKDAQNILKNFKIIGKNTGHIRVKFTNNCETEEVELFDGAIKL